MNQLAGVGQYQGGLSYRPDSGKANHAGDDFDSHMIEGGGSVQKRPAAQEDGIQVQAPENILGKQIDVTTYNWKGRIRNSELIYGRNVNILT